jgi:hypothetical protein
MRIYRDTIAKDLYEEETVSHAKQSSGLTSLDALYRYKGDDLDIGVTTPKQDIEQEFQSYVTLPPSPKVNMLNFWEVSRRNQHYYH